MQERHNSIANTLELRLSCTNPSNCFHGIISSVGGFFHQSMWWVSFQAGSSTHFMVIPPPPPPPTDTGAGNQVTTACFHWLHGPSFTSYICASTLARVAPPPVPANLSPISRGILWYWPPEWILIPREILLWHIWEFLRWSWYHNIVIIKTGSCYIFVCFAVRCVTCIISKLYPPRKLYHLK